MRARGRLLGLTGLAAATLAGGCGSNGSNGDEAESPPADQGAAQTITVAAAGDFGLEPPGVATLGAMAEATPDVYLGLGDFSYAGPDSPDEYCDLAHEALGENVPFEIVSGNHEEDPGEDGRIADFADCLPDRLDAVGNYATQYYFDLGELVRFIMISPDLTIDGQYYYYGADDDGGDTPQLAWLKDAISGARADGIEWIVVGMHKNCISVGDYYCDVSQDLFSTLIAEKVDLVLSGHDHSYQRSKQINAPAPGCRQVVVNKYDRDCVVAEGNAYHQGEGSTFVIAGAGGAPLYPMHPDDPEAGYFVATMGNNTPGNRSGFALLTITRERLQVAFVGSEPGSFQDSFEIAAGTS
jgi:Calcineurin-like phosphoesterase